MFAICFVLVDVEIAFDNSFDSIIIVFVLLLLFLFFFFYLRESLIWHTKILVKNSLQHMLSVEKSENIVFTFTLLIYP